MEGGGREGEVGGGGGRGKEGEGGGGGREEGEGGRRRGGFITSQPYSSKHSLAHLSLILSYVKVLLEGPMWFSCRDKSGEGNAP